MHDIALMTSSSERQVAEMGNSSASAGGQMTNSSLPQQHSPLTSPPATFAGESAPPVSAEVEAAAKVE